MTPWSLNWTSGTSYWPLGHQTWPVRHHTHSLLIRHYFETSYWPPDHQYNLWDIMLTCCFSNMCNIQPKPTTWFKLLMLRGIQKTVDGPWLSQRGWSYTFDFTTIPVTVDYPRGSPRGRSWRSYNLHWWFYGLKFTTIRATVDNPRGSPRGRSWRSYIPHPTNQERS